jgi:hypothetical protein
MRMAPQAGSSSQSPLSRREFLQTTLLGIGSLAFARMPSSLLQPEFPDGERLAGDRVSR